jgi:hypothetical protein
VWQPERHLFPQHLKSEDIMRRTLLSALKKGWRELLRELTDPYRPELHYMRGPGPKY